MPNQSSIGKGKLSSPQKIAMRGLILPSPPKNKKIKVKKKKKLFKIAWNGEKTSQTWFFENVSNKLAKEKHVVKNQRKIKIVLNCPKWRENWSKLNFKFEKINVGPKIKFVPN